MSIGLYKADEYTRKLLTLLVDHDVSGDVVLYLLSEVSPKQMIRLKAHEREFIEAIQKMHVKPYK